MDTFSECVPGLRRASSVMESAPNVTGSNRWLRAVDSKEGTVKTGEH